MRNQSSRCSNDDVRPQTKRFQLLVVSVSVVSTINGNASNAVEEIAEPLHGLVYLLCQFACRSHDDAVDGIFGKSSLV